MQGKVLELRHDGFSRSVEVPMSAGLGPIMRASQVAGRSVSGERSGWKLMPPDEAYAAVVGNPF